MGRSFIFLKMVSAVSITMVSVDDVVEAGESGLEWVDPSRLGRSLETLSVDWELRTPGPFAEEGVAGPSGK